MKSMKPRRDNDPEGTAIDEVRAVYKELASRPAERNCALRTECCQFKLTGRVPYLTRGEALVAARGLRSTGRKTLPVREDGACPMLDGKTGRCLIYEHRPFGCRTHFCRAAGGSRDRKDVIDLIHRLEAVGAAMGGSEARPLEAAVAEELARLR
jgi:hypothetical protein